MDIDVTDKVGYGNAEDEYLPITECVCGTKFGYWEFSIDIYKDSGIECPKCGRKFYFKSTITIYEITNTPE